MKKKLQQPRKWREKPGRQQRWPTFLECLQGTGVALRVPQTSSHQVFRAPSRSETLPHCQVEIMGAQRGEAPHHTGAKMPTQIGLGGACPDLWPYVMLPHSITCYHSIVAAVEKPRPWPFLHPFIADINFGR